MSGTKAHRDIHTISAAGRNQKIVIKLPNEIVQHGHTADVDLAKTTEALLGAVTSGVSVFRVLTTGLDIVLQALLICMKQAELVVLPVSEAPVNMITIIPKEQELNICLYTFSQNVRTTIFKKVDNLERVTANE